MYIGHKMVVVVVVAAVAVVVVINQMLTLINTLFVSWTVIAWHMNADRCSKLPSSSIVSSAAGCKTNGILNNLFAYQCPSTFVEWTLHDSDLWPTDLKVACLVIFCKCEPYVTFCSNAKGRHVTDRCTSRLAFTAQLRPQFRMPPVPIRGMMWTQHLWIRTSVVDCRCTTPPRRQYCCRTLRSAGGCRNGKLQNVSPPFVLFESNRIFLQYTEDTNAKKWWTRILKFEFCDF